MIVYKKALLPDDSECIVHLLTHENFLLPDFLDFHRTSFAIVTRIVNMNGEEVSDPAHSWINPSFEYITGRQCLINIFKDDSQEYAGIYFFKDKQSAMDYEIPNLI